MITVVDINTIPLLAPLISEVLFSKIQTNLAAGKKVLLSLNRKGAMSTLLCRDCGWVARCPACDLLMRVHHTPENFLLCHFCEAKTSIPSQCPKCFSYNLIQSGARVQAVEEWIAKLFPDARRLLVEWNIQNLSQKSLDENEIFIGTQKITSLPIENLGLAAFLLLEADLAVPVYDIEEEVYGQVRYFSSRADEVVIQTRSPKLGLIQELTQANFRTFYQRIIQERKQFWLPPFQEMMAIYVKEKQESTLKQRVATLASMLISGAQNTTISITYDHLLIERRGGDYYQKIVVKWPDIMQFLEPFRSSLVQGRGIEVEWL